MCGDIYIGETSIMFVQTGSGYINQPKEIIDYIKELQKEIENKNNEIDILKGQVEWWQQQCDDLEIQIGDKE